MSYRGLLKERDQKVDGHMPGDKWVWIDSDSGAWDGPAEDWEQSHKACYARHCKKFDVVVCAGGNQGMYPFLFSKMFQWVYTFEPDPLNFHCLVNNCQDDRIIKMNAALGSANKMIEVLRSSMTNTGMHKVGDSADAKVPCFMLDTFKFATLDLIQLDVEGHELEILRGALSTLQQHRPVVTMEGGRNPDINSIMTGLGYRDEAQTKSDTCWVPK